jgi:16S rRNA (guanine966-N2)-methyltransferase
VRIVGGTARGRPLLGPPKGIDLRPTSDKVREAVFDVLASLREGPGQPGGTLRGRVIDLFAGTGAFGIEALSRGASEAVFVERSTEARALIRENLRRLAFASRARVVAGEVLRALDRLASAGEAPFDLAFLDPPYASAAAGRAAERLVERRLLAPGGIVVIESGARDPGEAPPALELFRRKRYGDTCVAFLRPAGPSAGAARASGPGRAARSAAGTS